MKNCPFCSKEIEETAILCHHCGKSLWSHDKWKSSGGVKVVATLIILFSSLMLLGNGISPGGSELAAWAAIFSIVSAVGLLRLKKWAWYCSIIFLTLSLLFYLWGVRYHLRFPMDHFAFYAPGILIASAWPLTCIIYLIRPKVKKQFE